jgi:hypothetical protein
VSEERLMKAAADGFEGVKEKELLLALCRECASSGHDYHITNAHKDLRTWFNTVLTENEKDLRKGMVAQRKKNLADNARKKLTPQEIEALGLKKE